MKIVLFFFLVVSNLIAFDVQIVDEEKIHSLANTDRHTWWAKSLKEDKLNLLQEILKKENEFKQDTIDTSGNDWTPVLVPSNLIGTPGFENGLDFSVYKKVFYNSSKENRELSIRLGEISDRDEAYLNGVLIGRTGDWNATIPQAYDKVRIYHLPPDLIKPMSTNVLLIVCKGIIKTETGIYRDRVEIGPTPQILKAFYLENMLQILALVIYSTVSGYFLLFFIRRKQDKENFYFGLFTAALVVYSALRTQFKYEYGFELYYLKKIQYSAVFILMPNFYFFIRHFYKEYTFSFQKLWDNTFIGLNLIPISALFVVWLTQDVGLWDSYFNMIVQPFWIIYTIAILIILIRALLKKNKDALVMLASIIFLVVSIILDVLSGRAIINFPTVSTYVFIFFIISMALILANRFVALHNETEKLNEDLSNFNAASRRFVPFEFLKMLEKKSILDVRLGDQIQKEMTVLFSDIRGFTSLSENMTPKENFDFINSYLNKVGPVIRQHNGFIDKYIGDAVMALFPESIDDAIQAAIAMHERVVEWNLRREEFGFSPIQIGIGIHKGNLMLGTIGELERMDGTVIADAVNLASRIESLTKTYGSPILISKTALDGCKEKEKYLIRLVDVVRVKGKKDSVSLYEIFDNERDEIKKLKLDSINPLQEAITAFQKSDFTYTMKICKEIILKNRDDKAAMIFYKRSKFYKQHGVPEGWDGIEALTNK